MCCFCMWRGRKQVCCLSCILMPRGNRCGRALVIQWQKTACKYPPVYRTLRFDLQLLCLLTLANIISKMLMWAAVCCLVSVSTGSQCSHCHPVPQRIKSLHSGADFGEKISNSSSFLVALSVNSIVQHWCPVVLLVSVQEDSGDRHGPSVTPSPLVSFLLLFSGPSLCGESRVLLFLSRVFKYHFLIWCSIWGGKILFRSHCSHTRRRELDAFSCRQLTGSGAR